MDIHLIVKHPFGDYARGDTITDPETVAVVLAQSAEHVVRVTPHPKPADPKPAE